MTTFTEGTPVSQFTDGGQPQSGDIVGLVRSTKNVRSTILDVRAGSSHAEIFEDSEAGPFTTVALPTSGVYVEWGSASAGVVEPGNKLSVKVSDPGADFIRVEPDGGGTYRVELSVSWEGGTPAAKYVGTVHLNGVETGLKIRGGATLSSQVSGLIALAPTDVLDVRFKSDTASDTLDLAVVRLSAVREA